MPYKIFMSPEAIDHLQVFSAREQSFILDEIQTHLLHEPNTITRRRKRMRPNPLFLWELRIDQIRVFYDVEETKSEVQIMAIGRKQGNRLVIAGKEVKL